MVVRVERLLKLLGEAGVDRPTARSLADEVAQAPVDPWIFSPQPGVVELEWERPELSVRVSGDTLEVVSSDGVLTGSLDVSEFGRVVRGCVSC